MRAAYVAALISALLSGCVEKAGVFFNGQQLDVDDGNGDVLDLLNRRVREIVHNTDGQVPASPSHEAVIHVDGPLEYSFVIDATKAVSSNVSPDGARQSFVTRLRFASPDAVASLRDSLQNSTVESSSDTSRAARRGGAN